MVSKAERWLYGTAALAGVVGFVFVLLRRRKGESVSGSAGRAVGEGLVEAAVGAVGGINDAIVGSVEGALGVGTRNVAKGPAGAPPATFTNVARLYGSLQETSPGEWSWSVSNGGAAQDVLIEIIVDKWGLDPVRTHVGTYVIGNGESVRGVTETLVRSVTGILPITARLLADGYIVGKVG